MAQCQTQRRFGLLQQHFSQQETIPVPAISSSRRLPDQVTSQISSRHTESDVLGLAQYRAIPGNLDLTTYHPTATRPYPIANLASPTMPHLMLDQEVPIMDETESNQVAPLATHIKKPSLLRLITIASILLLSIAIYLIWHPIYSPSPAPPITHQNFGSITPKVSSSKSNITADTTANSGGDIQVYILGAVLHPGIYTLPANARVYQLLQAAGGPLPKADLVSLNLAAKLIDGQEIYVTSIGESPPAINSGSLGPSLSSSSVGSSSSQPLVNINTASASELSQKLSVSSKTAQTIVSYRQQHGPFTSVDQLLQVVSQSIYDKIKNKVTV